MEETKIVKIDGIGVNATFFAGLSKEAAVTEMVEGGVAPGKSVEWAERAYETCKEEVEKANSQESEEDTHRTENLL